jgi:hypothetical protein
MEHFLTHMFLGWVLRGASPDAEPSADGRAWVMRVSSRFTKVWIGLTLAFAVMLILCLVGAHHEPKPDPKADLIILGVFGPLVLLSLHSVIECYKLTVTLDVGGLSVHRPFLGLVRIEWRDIKSVSYSHAFWALKIKPAVGSSRRISLGMNGLRTLACYLHRYAPGTIALDAPGLLPIPAYFLSPPPGVDTSAE